jgi:hypothetical protein
LAVDSPVVDDQLHDLLFRQAGFESKIRQSHVITGLRLILQILALA